MRFASWYTRLSVHHCGAARKRSLSSVAGYRHFNSGVADNDRAILVNLNRVAAYAFHISNNSVPQYIARLLVRLCDQNPKYVAVLSEGDAAWKRRDQVLESERLALAERRKAGENVEEQMNQLNSFPNFRETYLSKTSTHAINEYYEQLEMLTKGLGISWIHSALEADLVISKLCTEFVHNGTRVSIVTPSKLLQQLVKPEVELVPPISIFKTDTPVMDMQKYLEENQGLPPSNIPDLLALIGVPSIGIPGVKGVGRITAFKLLGKFNTLEGVIEGARSGDIQQTKLREAILNREHALQVSKRLVKLDASQVELGFALDSLKLRTCDPETLEEVARELDIGVGELVR